MDVNALVIALRQRNHWSAIDLGAMLARKWWLALLLSWLLPALPVYLLLMLLLYDFPMLALFILWWLKPIFERFGLYIVSRRLFGEPTSAMDALRAWRDVCRPDVIPWQLWRRLNPLRAFVMPVTLLERLQGKRREKRLAVLQMEASGPAVWLTVIGIHIEGLFPLFYLLLINLLVPAELLEFDLFETIVNDENAFIWLGNTLTFVTMALVAPFYVSSGFLLYINRRVSLEGWDLELGFKQLLSRAEKSGRNRGALNRAAALLVFTCVLSVATGSELAQAAKAVPTTSIEATLEPSVEPSVEPASGDPLGSGDETTVVRSLQAQNMREAIDEVMAGEAFNEVRESYSWRWKYADDEEEPEAESEIPQWVISLVEIFEFIFPDWDIDASEAVAWLLRAVIVALLMGVLGYIVLRYRQTIAAWLRDNGPVAQRPEEPPDSMFGLAVKRESLPQDVPLEVQTLWQRGEQRGAVALLYRATLSTLIHQYDFRFTEDLTENECAAMVAAGGDLRLSEFFGDLSCGWQALAYGHREPQEAWLVAACDQWRRVFEHE